MPLQLTAITALFTTVVLTLSSCTGLGKVPAHVARAAPPALDYRAWVGADRNREMEGYLLATPVAASSACWSASVPMPHQRDT